MKNRIMLPAILFLFSHNIHAQIIRVSPSTEMVDLVCEEWCDEQYAPLQFDYPGQQGGQFYIQFFASRLCPDDSAGMATGGYLKMYPGSSGGVFDIMTHEVMVLDEEGNPALSRVVSRLENGHVVSAAHEFTDGYTLQYDGHGTMNGTSITWSQGYDDWSWTMGAVGFRLHVYGQIHYGYMNLTVIGGNNSNGFIISVTDIFIEQTANLAIGVGDLPYCPTDLDGNGQTDVQDIIIFNSEYGHVCSGCPEDVNGSGTVDIEDFLLLNSRYGESCE